MFYTACIRSVLTYSVCASPVFFHALPKYLINELECVEERALSIICPGLSTNLPDIELLNIVLITDFNTAICNETFDSIVRDPEHHLHSLLPFCGPSLYALKHNRHFVIPTHKTKHLENNFIIRSCSNNAYL